jgi:hypothetical protein
MEKKEFEYMPSHFNHWNEDKQFRAGVYFMRKYKYEIKEKLKDKLRNYIRFSLLMLTL